jgi:hypothetical protein
MPSSCANATPYLCPRICLRRRLCPCPSMPLLVSMPVPNESPYLMPIQMHMCNAQCLFPCRCYAISNICGYVSHRHLLLFFLMIHHIFGYSLLHMNNEWLLINHVFVIILPMHMPITLSTPRPMPLHMPMPLPMPLLILKPLTKLSRLFFLATYFANPHRSATVQFETLLTMFVF